MARFSFYTFSIRFIPVSEWSNAVFIDFKPLYQRIHTLLHISVQPCPFLAKSSPLSRQSLKKPLLQDVHAILHIPYHRQLFHSFEALSEMPGQRLHIQNSLGIEAFQLLLLKALFKMKAPGFFSILFPQTCGR